MSHDQFITKNIIGGKFFFSPSNKLSKQIAQKHVSCNTVVLFF